MAEEIEYTLLQIKECFVCRVPPRMAAGGHRAADWDRTPIWSGRLRLVVKGVQCTLMLENLDGKLYVAAPITNSLDGPQSVEKVIDSSRYFVVRVEDGKGRKAFLGLFFEKQDTAFDFKVHIQDHQKHVHQLLSKSDQQSDSDEDKPPSDQFTIPAGHSIHINLKSTSKRHSHHRKTDNSAKSEFRLSAPPSSGDKVEAKKSHKSRHHKHSKDKSPQDKHSRDKSPRGANAPANVANVLPDLSFPNNDDWGSFTDASKNDEWAQF